MTQHYPPPPPYGSDPRQWQGYAQQPPPQPPKQKWTHGKLGALALLGVAMFVACGIAGTNTSAPRTATSPTAASAAPAVPAAKQEAEDAPAAASGPLTSFDDGTYEVGTGNGQVAPGKYRSAGSSMCYYARLKNNDGELGDIIDNNLGSGQKLLNVKKTDGYVEVRGCTFTKAA